MSRNKAVILLILVTGMLLTACQSRSADSVQEQTLFGEGVMLPQEVNYNIVEAAFGDYQKLVQGNAGRGSVTLEYVLEKDLYWETQNARFQEVLVREGDFVKEGDTLAVFDLEADTVALKELELELARTREEYARGCRDKQDAITEATEDTLEEGLTLERLRIEELQVEKLQVAYEQYVYQMERTLAALEEDLTELREEVENNTLIAPFDGVVSWVIPYSKGDKVSAGATLITMFSPNEFYLKTTDYVDQLKYATEITLEAGNKNDRKTYVGRVVSAPYILPDTVSQKYAYVRLDPGVTLDKLTGTISYSACVEELQDVLLVRKSAIHSEDGKSYVYLLEDDIVKKRYVQTGVSNTEMIWLLDGVEPGQSLILD